MSLTARHWLILQVLAMVAWFVVLLLGLTDVPFRFLGLPYVTWLFATNGLALLTGILRQRAINRERGEA